MKYTFRGGNRYSVSADVAGVELERIHQRDGVITAAVVVNESRPEDAPLHPVFEWRDEVAAENYRHYQARTMIRSVHKIEEDRPEPTPVYVNVGPNETTRGYQPVSIVVTRPNMYANALAELAKKLHAAEKALAELKSAADAQPDSDQERMARIAIAVQAMQTASAAIQALH